VRNLNGVNELEMKVDGQSTFHFDFDTLYHHQGRYINAHKDYHLYQTDDAYVNRMFRLPGNILDIYDTDDRQGIIPIHTGNTKQVEIKVSDSFDNNRSIAFTITKGTSLPSEDGEIFNHEIKSDESSTFNLGELFLSFPRGCVYQTVATRITSRFDEELGQKVCSIHDRNDPVHLPYRIALYLPEVPDSLRSKYYIAGINSKGDEANFGGYWSGDTLITKLRGFGEFTVGMDNLPPTISLRGGPESKIKGKDKISFTIKDQLPRAPLKYQALLDGEWCLMEYDSKKDRLTHYFDWERHQQGQNGWHQLELKVTDRNGNSANKTIKFFSEP